MLSYLLILVYGVLLILVYGDDGESGVQRGVLCSGNVTVLCERGDDASVIFGYSNIRCNGCI